MTELEFEYSVARYQNLYLLQVHEVLWVCWVLWDVGKCLLNLVWESSGWQGSTWTMVCKIRNPLSEQDDGRHLRVESQHEQTIPERKAEWVWGRASHLLWLLTDCGMSGELWFPTIWIKQQPCSEKEENNIDSREIRWDLIGLTLDLEGWMRMGQMKTEREKHSKWHKSH